MASTMLERYNCNDLFYTKGHYRMMRKRMMKYFCYDCIKETLGQSKGAKGMHQVYFCPLKKVSITIFM